MSDKLKDRILTFLTRLDNRTERMQADIANLKDRMSLLEERLAHLDHSTLLLSRSYGTLQSRIDRLEPRLDQIHQAQNHSEVRQ